VNQFLRTRQLRNRNPPVSQALQLETSRAPTGASVHSEKRADYLNARINAPWQYFKARRAFKGAIARL
jgi:hypothetical protein